MLKISRPMAIPAVLAMSLLTACSGGSGAISPILTDGGAINPADFVGKTFPFRFIGVDTSGAATPVRGVGTVKVISANEIQITFNGMTHDLTETMTPGEFAATDLTAEQSDLSTALRNISATVISDSSVYVGAYGFQTNPDALPDMNSAFFTGSSELVVSDGLGGVDIESGSSNLEIDFGTGNFSGFVFTGDMPGGSGETITLDIVPFGSQTGNQVTGTLMASYDDGINPLSFPALDSTDIDGWLYGNSYEQLIGTFEGNFTVPLDGNVRFVGGFFADRI